MKAHKIKYISVLSIYTISVMFFVYKLPGKPSSMKNYRRY